MIRKNIIRLLYCLLFGVILSSTFRYWGCKDITIDLPKTLFDVQGILFPVVLAVAISMDFLRVRNAEIRKQFRLNIGKVRQSVIIQFIFSFLAIGTSLLIDHSEGFAIYWILHLFPRLTSTIIISYSIIHTITNFIQMQHFKEELEDKLQDEEK